MRCQDKVGRAMQVGAGHGAAKVSNARWRIAISRPAQFDFSSFD
jgi:hypothetical protein